MGHIVCPSEVSWSGGYALACWDAYERLTSPTSTARRTAPTNAESGTHARVPLFFARKPSLTA